MKTSRPGRRTRRSNQCLFQALEPRQLMAAGAMDTSFSLDGKATLEFGSGQFFARDVAVQGDGKTVVIGGTTRGPHAIEDFVVARFNFDGSLDPSFGPTVHRGFVATPFGTNASATAVALQADGKIVVVGHLNHDKWAVARYLPNGTLDASFDGDGRQTIGFDGDANDVIVQGDGKILIIGANNDEGILSGLNHNFAVARLNPNGRLDTTFNGGGKKEVGFDSEFDFAEAAAIDSAGRIVVVGDSDQSPSGNVERSFALTRLKRDGTKDTSFGNAGTVVTSFPGHLDSTANGVLIQPNGKIVVVGRTGESLGQKYSFAMARYLPSGRLDTTFGSAGTGRVELPIGTTSALAFDVIEGGAGLVVAGLANNKFAVASFSADGRLASSFGNRGTVVTDFGAAGAGNVFDGVALAKGPGRRFVVAGGSHFKSARYLEFGANQVGIEADGLSGNFSAAETRPGGLTDTATFKVSRGEALPVPTRVFLSIGGTAQQPGQLFADYTLGGVTLRTSSRGGGSSPVATPFVDIPAGRDSVIITLKPIDDARMEQFETATFSVVPNAKYRSGPGRITHTIDDNDEVRINFQPAGPAPAGYRADVGHVFGARGNGLSYGWDADNTLNARVRNDAGSPDARYDTLTKMQDGVDRTWEIALPNGLYAVRLVAGDPSFTDSVYRMNLEGTTALAGTPAGDTRWFRSTVHVQVSDGRLTLSNAIGAINNKIAFIDIRSAGSTARPGPVVPNVPVRAMSAATAPLWHRLPNGLFADNQIDELLWT